VPKGKNNINTSLTPPKKKSPQSDMKADRRSRMKALLSGAEEDGGLVVPPCFGFVSGVYSDGLFWVNYLYSFISLWKICSSTTFPKLCFGIFSKGC
jgi:hypothetical protein